MTRWPSAALGLALLFLAALTILLLLRGLNGAAPDEVSTALQMRDIARKEGIWDNRWHRHEEKARALGQELARESDASRRVELRRQLAEQFLQAGSAQAAAAELTGLLDQYGALVPPDYRSELLVQLAVSHLRSGELQNCVWNHNAERCVFPIRAGGVHAWTQGARQALDLLSGALDSDWLPEDQFDRLAWLGNIAAMTLGLWPDEVPRSWRLPPERLQSAADIGRFVDVAEAAGVAELGLSGGALIEDFNGDGRLDIMASSWGYQDPLAYFENRGGLRFERRSEAAGLNEIHGGLNLIQADYDNDGDTDVLLLRGAWLHQAGQHTNTLLRNDGGHFTDVTWAAGLRRRLPTQTAVWADFDNDGWLDLFIGNEIVRSRIDWPADTPAFELYRNDRRGGFADAADGSGIQLDGLIKGSTAGDFDNDGWVDLYVSIWGAPNRLFRNLGGEGQPLRFADVTGQAGVAEPVASFPTWFWDYDNDGWLDIFVAGYQAAVGDIAREYAGKPGAQGTRPRLYRNLGNGRFEDRSAALGLDQLLLAMGANFGDFDNDGWPDLLIGTGAPPFEQLVPNRAFRNRAGQAFEDITSSGGFGHLQKGHGVAFGDLDADGDQDIYATIGGAFASDRFWNALYENPGHGNDWIGLRLEGRQSNHGGLGSRIRVRLTNGREIHALVGTGGSFGGSAITQHIGLGAEAVISEIRIHWAGSGREQTISGPVPAGRRYRVGEGDRALRPITP